MGRLEAIKLFSKMVEWIHRILSKFFPKKGEVDLAASSAMEAAIQLWSDMYADRAPWVKGDVKSLNLPSGIASEMARLITLEMKTELTGSQRADFLQESYGELIQKLRSQIEYGCAKGGMVFKPYVANGEMHVECVQADAFYPVNFDSSGRLMGAVFSEQIARAGKIYTRLESHDFAVNKCIITNKAYVSKSNASLGHEIELSEVPEWADLEPELLINDIDRPVFGYFKPAMANTVDPSSPLGVSVYSRAVSLIEQADRQYSRLLWEFEGSELAVDAAVDVLIPRSGDTSDFDMPKLNKRLFRGLESSDQEFYKVFSPTIRDQSIINGLNALLRKIEFNCGLAYGTLSDVQAVDKTAEEIRASKQRSYAAVCDNQRALQRALEDTVYAMNALANLLNLAPAGVVKQSFEWDDSIVADRQAEFAERMQLQTAASLRPEINVAWYFGVSEDEAKEMLQQGTGADDFWGKMNAIP